MDGQEQAVRVNPGGGIVGPTQLTITEQLQQREERLVLELADVRAAIAALNKSPEVQEAVDAISKLGGLRY